jgi:hypothetical protein
MKRILATLTIALGLTVGSVAGTPTPADAHVPQSIYHTCLYVLEASDYGSSFNVDPYDLRMIHYGDYHIYQCAARRPGASPSENSLCYQYTFETHVTSFWGTRPRYQCN